MRPLVDFLPELCYNLLNMKTKIKIQNRYIYTFFVLFLSLATPVNADVHVENDSTSDYFAARIKNNQGEEVALTVVSLSNIGNALNNVIPHNSFTSLKSYDRRLPYVNYSIRKPQEFQK